MRTSENELSGRDGLPKNNRILSIDGVLQVSGDGGWAGRILSACKAPSCILGALHTQLPLIRLMLWLVMGGRFFTWLSHLLPH